MQQHNKNKIIADELEAISQKIISLDKESVTDSISEIHDFHKEIEEIARNHDLTTLLAIVDWVDLSTELDDDNSTKIENLLATDAYSNWLNVVIDLLKDYNDNLRPVIHQSLTSPEWIVKPSTILLKDIASWIATIKAENESDQSSLENDTISEDESGNDNIDSNSELESIASTSIIEDQLKKAEDASEEAMHQQNVFEEIDEKILEKDYTTDTNVINDVDTIEEENTALVETEKSSIDDEKFEISNLDPVEADIIEKQADTAIVLDNDSPFREITDIHQALDSSTLNHSDVFAAKDTFTKQLEKLSIITENTELDCIVPVIDWTQRNLLLFQDNPSADIEKFISTGKSWSWIKNISSCLAGIDKTECLESLTTSLTHKQWLEPLDKNDLEALLVGINNKLESKKSEEDEAIEATNLEESISSIASVELIDNNELIIEEESELLDVPSVIDKSEETEINTENDPVHESSGLQMTWDDDTHPELLMVYLEETPSQIEELLPLLEKISNANATNEDKNTAARLAHTIKGGSSVVGISSLSEISSHLETLLEHSLDHHINEKVLKELPEIGHCINSTFKAVQVQGDEPEEFLAHYNSLKEYKYELDSEIKENDSNVSDLDSKVSDTNIENEQHSVDHTIDEKESVASEVTNTINSLETENTDSESTISSNSDESSLAEIATIATTSVAAATVIGNKVFDDSSSEDEVLETNNTIETEDQPTLKSENDHSQVENNSEDFTDETESETLLDTKIDIENNTEKVVNIDEEIAEEPGYETSGFSMTWHDDTHPELLMVYLEETPTQIKELVPLMFKISKNEASEDEKHTASRMAHTIKGGSAIVGLTTLSELSYRLETLLDHSVKHQLPNDILEELPKAASCIEVLFEEIQMVGEEPKEYFEIFKKLDHFVENIDENEDEELELSSVALPDFILNQNNNNNLADEHIDASIDDDSSTTLIDAESEEEVMTTETDSEITSDETIDNNKTEITKEESYETSGFSMTWHDDTHPELLMVYLEETPTQINELVPLLHKISKNEANADEKHTASRMAHTIKGGSAIVGLTTLSELSYRLETLLDHSVKYQLPDDILETLPKTASCIENLFEEIQMAGEEPKNYFEIFKKLDHYVENIEDNDDEVLELSSVALPDFILNQNNDSTKDEVTDVSSLADMTDNDVDVNELDSEDTISELSTEETEVKVESSDKESEETTNLDVESTTANDSEELEKETEELTAEVEEEITEDIHEKDTEQAEKEAEEIKAEIQTELAQENEVMESVAVDAVKLDKLKTQEDVNNILVEIDDIVINLISLSTLGEQPKEYLKKCSVELDRFELMTDLSGYPELSLLSKWCQSNLESHAKDENEKFAAFIQSNEIWSWVEHVGECLRESDDMSHMSSLSVELMREDWLNAIKMEDLQTVLLALRHLEDTGVDETSEIQTETNDINEVISWDKDVHPELLAVYFQETPDQIDHVAGLLHKISRGESTTEENKEAARIAHTIKGSSGVVGLNQLLELTHHLEDILDYSVNNDINSETADLLSEASDCMESLFETIQNKQAAPDELPSVLERLSTFSGKLSPEDKSNHTYSLDDEHSDTADISTEAETSEASTSSATTEKTSKTSVDTNEAYIRVPITVIDKLLNLAGELVTTSNQVSDNLAKTQETNKTVRNQDERVLTMLDDLNKTIEQQEKDQQNLFSSMDNSDFDSLEMDTYNELNSVASLLSEGILDSQEIDNTLNRQLNELSEKLHSLDKLNKNLSDVILSSRMVTIDTIVPRLERIVRQTCRKTNKKARLVVTGNSLNVDTDILNNLVDPLLHMLRNSIDHGIETPEERIKNNKDETGLIELGFSRDGNNILMKLKDDGAGINPEKVYEKAIEKEIITPDQEFSDADAIKLILQPGFSTQENVTDISGRGVGMDVVNTSIQDLNGTMGIDSHLGEGTSFNLTIPLTLITNTTLLVKVEDNLIAIPTDTIEQIMYQEASSMIKRDDEFYILHNDAEIKTQALGELLNWPHQLIDEEKSYNVLIIKTDEQTHAIHVDGIESSREVVVKRLSPWVSPAKGVIGACHLNDGGVAPVINLITVAKALSMSAKTGNHAPAPKQIIKPDEKKQILVVDDSLSNRKALSLIIEKTAYDVVTAVDGLDALRVMNEKSIDLVFTDLEMPRMNGLELTQSIRAWNDKSKTPIVMITSRTTNKHRELAKKAGVDDYLTKPVETDTLLTSIETWLESEVEARLEA